jgi:hypothetical protein
MDIQITTNTAVEWIRDCAKFLFLKLVATPMLHTWYQLDNRINSLAEGMLTSEDSRQAQNKRIVSN